MKYETDFCSFAILMALWKESSIWISSARRQGSYFYQKRDKARIKNANRWASADVKVNVEGGSRFR
jgi:hypothetical protein